MNNELLAELLKKVDYLIELHEKGETDPKAIQRGKIIDGFIEEHGNTIDEALNRKLWAELKPTFNRDEKFSVNRQLQEHGYVITERVKVKGHWDTVIVFKKSPL